MCQRASPLAPVGAGDAGQCPGAASHLEAYRRLNREGLAINVPKQLHQLRLYDGVQLLLPGQDASTSRGSTRSPRGWRGEEGRRHDHLQNPDHSLRAQGRHPPRTSPGSLLCMFGIVGELAAAPARLEDLKPDALVQGLVGREAVRIVSAEMLGDPAGSAPYLDYRPLQEAEQSLVGPLLQESWLAQVARERADVLVIPAGLLLSLQGLNDPADVDATARKRVELLAMNAVFEAE